MNNCTHLPQCPPADAPNHDEAHVRVAHHEQGWSQLCNGVIVFDDLGELFPDGHTVDAQFAEELHRLAVA
jgi:hypothetical protein